MQKNAQRKNGCGDRLRPFLLVYYIKKHLDFAIKCQKVLAKCAKRVYTVNVILCNAHLCIFYKEG